MYFPKLHKVANTSFVDATRFALKPCASKVLQLGAAEVGNLAWSGISENWQAQTAKIYTAFAATAVTAVFCATHTHNKISFTLSAGIGIGTGVLALKTLFNQVVEIQTWAPKWDFQYPNANISYIAQKAPFYCR